MDKIGNYQLLEAVSQDAKAAVYKARREPDGEPVIAKLLITAAPTRSDIARFHQEHEIIQTLDHIDGIVRTRDLIECEDGIVLILEEIDAVSLKQYMGGTPLDILTFLDVAIALADILGHLHKENVIHRNIKPQNILINHISRKIWITDFGISYLLKHHDESLYDQTTIRGTLQYLSPEQTGRMNRQVDYRTDLYSLGITFYEMLIGAPPFQSDDPMELMHAHLAVAPDAPSLINPAIPVVLSDIVLKLMAKPAEDRYQNAFGLLHDLRQCKAELSESGGIRPFTIGTRDIPLTFSIPHVFVGRKAEKEKLITAFDRCANNGRPEAVLISGYPGIGKTFLVNEIVKPVTARKGYFIAAKYEPLGRDVPYSAIIHAFSNLVNQLLAEDQDRIAEWREIIQNALGDTGKILTDVLPMLSLLIGDQPEVPQLAPEPARNRFLYVFKNFVRSFTHPSHPLVLFLDDLQWADHASLQFIESLLSDASTGSLFFISAYRHNEIQETHLLHSVVATINRSLVNLETHYIAPLTTSEIREYLVHCLRVNARDTAPLVELVESKTRGNPFFINQFLQTLYDRKLIEPDETGGWGWNIEAIKSLAVTDNVIDLMAEKITELPVHSRDVMKLAACVGNTFDIAIVAQILEQPADMVLNNLLPAQDAGLLQFSGDMGSFVHDRIQEAAYSLIPETERYSAHYAIGRHMNDITPEADREEAIFQIANQFNAGIAAMPAERADTDRIHIARLNLMAGKKAMAATAYQPAFEYFQAGMALLTEDDWHHHYQITYDLYIQAAEAAYMNGAFNTMETCLKTVLTHATTLMDRVKVYEIRILAFSTQSRLGDATEAARDVFPLLGINLPDPITGESIMAEIAKTDKLLAGLTDDAILNTPPMTDTDALAALQVMTTAASAFYSGGYTDEIIIIVLKMIRLSLKKGIAPQTPYWFSCYAMTLYSLNQLEIAFRFADMALMLKNKFTVQQEIRTEFLVYTFIAHWQESIKDTTLPLRDLFQRGLELGDLEYSYSALATYSFLRFAGGIPLKTLQEENDSFIGSMKTHNMFRTLNYQLPLAQTIENLVENPPSPVLLQGELFNARDMETDLIAANDRLTLFLICLFSLELAVFFGDTDKALAFAEKGKEYLPAAAGGMHHIVPYYFYRCLARLTAIQGKPTDMQAQMFPKIAYARERLTHWAAHAPANIQHKIDLVNAEEQRIRGADADAELLYEKAINGARDNGFIQEQALAFELAAGFYKNRGLKNIAGLYLRQSMACYAEWGAHTKVLRLQAAHPEIAAEILTSSGHRQRAPAGITASLAKKTAMLDISTVIKASQAISEEIVLDKLLNRLLEISIENAGARRGALIFERNGELFIEAESSVDGDVATSGTTPLAICDRFPGSIIQYVHTTGKNVVIENATLDNEFSRDPYIRQNRIKSILCAPVRRKEKITAIFYAENNLTPNTFTPEGLETLTILSAQAAISIENASLFEEVNKAKEEIRIHRDHLEELVEERTRALKAAQAELVENAHQAGMADIAVGVLHNVGNVLNSVRTSIHAMNEIMENSKGFDGIDRANRMLREKMQMLDDFIVNDPKGKKLMQYYLNIGDILARDREALAADLNRLDEKTKTIANIITAQQSYVSAGAMAEELDIGAIADDALAMLAESLKNRNISVDRHFQPAPPVRVDKTKLVHVLINIIRNAIDAMANMPTEQRKLTLTITSHNKTVQMALQDTGNGIEPEDLQHVFAHGFTTKPDGHGFGLHTSANYVTEMGGHIWAESEGPGKGSTFVLEFPVQNN
ncbi:MAG: AAA family ATPase [Thermodesulfobacteriota bacterium]|nr:AAA family ATPase [Thermodesulfobacteriota bacterium]